MLTCREVTQLVATDQLRNAARWRRLSVMLHQAMCQHCRRYARQLRAMADAARGTRNDPALLQSVQEVERRLANSARPRSGGP